LERFLCSTQGRQDDWRKKGKKQGSSGNQGKKRKRSPTCWPKRGIGRPTRNGDRGHQIGCSRHQGEYQAPDDVQPPARNNSPLKKTGRGSRGNGKEPKVIRKRYIQPSGNRVKVGPVKVPLEKEEKGPRRGTGNHTCKPAVPAWGKIGTQFKEV